MGVQDVTARDFAVRKTVVTGSWLGRAYQGRGYGTEMRAAVLTLAFDGLGADRAESGYFTGNAQSAGVSAKLGYVDNGDQIYSVGRERVSNVASESAAKHGSAAWCRSRSKAWNRASSCSA